MEYCRIDQLVEYALLMLKVIGLMKFGTHVEHIGLNILEKKEKYTPRSIIKLILANKLAPSMEFP